MKNFITFISAAYLTQRFKDNVTKVTLK